MFQNPYFNKSPGGGEQSGVRPSTQDIVNKYRNTDRQSDFQVEEILGSINDTQQTSQSHNDQLFANPMPPKIDLSKKDPSNRMTFGDNYIPQNQKMLTENDLYSDMSHLKDKVTGMLQRYSVQLKSDNNKKQLKNQIELEAQQVAQEYTQIIDRFNNPDLSAISVSESTFPQQKEKELNQMFNLIEEFLMKFKNLSSNQQTQSQLLKSKVIHEQDISKQIEQKQDQRFSYQQQYQDQKISYQQQNQDQRLSQQQQQRVQTYSSPAQRPSYQQITEQQKQQQQQYIPQQQQQQQQYKIQTNSYQQQQIQTFKSPEQRSSYQQLQSVPQKVVTEKLQTFQSPEPQKQQIQYRQTENPQRSKWEEEVVKPQQQRQMDMTIIQHFPMMEDSFYDHKQISLQRINQKLESLKSKLQKELQKENMPYTQQILMDMIRNLSQIIDTQDYQLVKTVAYKIEQSIQQLTQNKEGSMQLYKYLNKAILHSKSKSDLFTQRASMPIQPTQYRQSEVFYTESNRSKEIQQKYSARQSEQSSKRQFYDAALIIKNSLPPNHPKRDIMITDLFDEYIRYGGGDMNGFLTQKFR